LPTRRVRASATNVKSTLFSRLAAVAGTNQEAPTHHGSPLAATAGEFYRGIALRGSRVETQLTILEISAASPSPGKKGPVSVAIASGVV
jgi:hypothetical protein